MPRAELNLSEYKIMWLLTMFDLPMTTKTERRNYTRFRSKLLANGFTQLQYSVYARCCGSEEIAETFKGRIESSLPPDGYVRVLSVTDRQFGKMQSFYGKKREQNEKAPDQLMLF